MIIFSTLGEPFYSEPCWVSFNGFFWKGFKNQEEGYYFLMQFNPRDFFAVQLHFHTPF